MKFRNALLGATLMTLPAAAFAQPVSGLYVGGGAGVNWLMPQSVGAAGDTKTHLGFAGVASMGWGYGNGLRAEIEGNWRSNKVHAIGNSGAEGGGRIDTVGVMVNALFDMDIGVN